MKKFLMLVFCSLFCMSSAQAGDDLLNMYQGYAGDTQTSLDKAHRGVDEMGAWLSETVADALNFPAGSSNRKLSALRPQFSDQGYQSYVNFLADMGFADALQKQTLTLSSVVNSAPLLIGQGSSAGRYAWAYEMKVLLTANLAPGQPPVTRDTTVRIQVGRSAKGPAPNGVLIESWQEFKEAPPADSSGKPANQP